MSWFATASAAPVAFAAVPSVARDSSTGGDICAVGVITGVVAGGFLSSALADEDALSGSTAAGGLALPDLALSETGADLFGGLVGNSALPTGLSSPIRISGLQAAGSPHAADGLIADMPNAATKAAAQRIRVISVSFRTSLRFRVTARPVLLAGRPPFLSPAEQR